MSGTPDPIQTGTAASWTLRDYVAPGLRVVRPDACFPHLRAGSAFHHPWTYLRRDVPHWWYSDERFPLMGFMNRDEAALLHNLALQFAGKPALEIGGWLGWSTCHAALAGVAVDVIDPAHDDPAVRAQVQASLVACGVADRVRLWGGTSPDSIAQLPPPVDGWSLFMIDGDHEGPAPVRDALACIPHAAADCAFVFHDAASPAVAAALRLLSGRGFQVALYQTAQILGLAWRGRVDPVPHRPDPDVAWQLPVHLAGLPVFGIDRHAPDPAVYRPFPELECAKALAAPAVCIVTNELVGPFKNGGIGTAMTGLAETLAAEGHRVTVLYTGDRGHLDSTLRPWRKRYAELGIQLATPADDGVERLAGPVSTHGFGLPWLVYVFLAKRAFDVIHFNDCCGDGSLSLAAKRLGLAFHDTLLVVALHSPSRWVLELNHTLPTSLLLSAFECAERLSVQCTDLLWSPSRYMLAWATLRDFELPLQTFVQQYAIPTPRLRDGAAASSGFPVVAYGRAAPPREIVFFGRLEERKGLRWFCDACHLLQDELARRDITVTFLGKPGQCAGLPSLDYIAQRAAAWQFPLRTRTDLGQPEALMHLRRGGSLAVMPSPLDNSPCTIYEALSWGIPFLAARTGGIPELVAEADRDLVCFAPTPEGLHRGLLDAIEHGGWVARPATTQDETRRSWTAMHSQWRNFLPSRAVTAARAFTTSAVIDHCAGTRLDRTLESLAACPEIRRVIVLNRSGQPLAGHHGGRVPQDSRAFAEELASITDEAVLLIHAGTAIAPAAFEAMVGALASTPIDGLIPAGAVTDHRGARIVPPLGGSAAFSLFEGVTYTGALLVRRELLASAIWERPLSVESPFMGVADYCVIRGRRIWPYPALVVESEAGSRFASRSADPVRVRAYDDAPANERFYMLAAGYGACSANDEAATGVFQAWEHESAASPARTGVVLPGKVVRAVARVLRRVLRRLR